LEDKDNRTGIQGLVAIMVVVVVETMLEGEEVQQI
jgi:cobalamin synthase